MLSSYGWNENTTCTIENNKVKFINTENLINMQRKIYRGGIVEIAASIDTNNIDDVGIVLWYNDEKNYIKIVFNKFELNVYRLKNDSEDKIKTYIFSQDEDEEDSDELISRDIKIVIDNTNTKIYMDDDTLPILDFEDNAFKEGYFGVVGYNGSLLTSFDVKTSSLVNWTNHISNGNTIIEDGNNVLFRNLNDNYNYMSQSVSLESGTYTLSINYIGNLKVIVKNGTENVFTETFESEDVITVNKTFALSAAATIEVQIGNSSVGDTYCYYIQLEKASHVTSYTYSERNDAKLSVPGNKIYTDSGTLTTIISMYDVVNTPILYLNETFNIKCINGDITFKYGDTTYTFDTNLEKDTIYKVFIQWQNNEYIRVMTSNAFDSSQEITNYKTLEKSDLLYIGCLENEAGNIFIDNVTIYDTTKEFDNISWEYNTSNIPNCLIHLNFNEEIYYGANTIAIPLDKLDAPMIIHSTNTGKEYKRVSFVKDNQYVLYDVVYVEYKENYIFESMYGDILSANIYCTNDDTEIINYEIYDNKIKFNLDETYIGKTLYIMYYTKDTYCLNYDDNYNQYILRFANLDGDTIQIERQNEYNRDIAILNEIELNPFMSVNNEGFICIEDRPREMTTFDVRITPEAIVSKKNMEATITIDCLDKDGIVTSYVQTQDDYKHGLTVKCLGTLSEPIYEYKSPKEKEYETYIAIHGKEKADKIYGNMINDKLRAGRFVYKFKITDELKGFEGYKTIIIKDNYSNIGVRAQMRIIAPVD